MGIDGSSWTSSYVFPRWPDGAKKWAMVRKPWNFLKSWAVPDLHPLGGAKTVPPSVNLCFFNEFSTTLKSISRKFTTEKVRISRISIAQIYLDQVKKNWFKFQFSPNRNFDEIVIWAYETTLLLMLSPTPSPKLAHKQPKIKKKQTTVKIRLSCSI